MVFVPIAHDLVQAATVHAAGQAAHVLYPVTKERGTWRKFLVVDMAVEGLVHSEDELRHAAKSPYQVLQNSLSRRDRGSEVGHNYVRFVGMTNNQKSAIGPKRTSLVALPAFDPKRTLACRSF